MIPPENPNMTAAEREWTTAQLFAQMDATPCLTDTSRHPGMHRTRTIDHVVLLSGEVTMLLDKGEVELKPFDVVVQRGTSHAWVNKGKAPALLAAVLIDPLRSSVSVPQLLQRPPVVRFQNVISYQSRPIRHY
jgi:mannose-6-phosphate isomerase-like protein (cupin superfamily)